MKRSDLIWGSLLIGAGGLLLLQNFGWLGAQQDLIWSGLFLLSALAFLGLFIAERTRWWLLLPGVTLLSLSALIGLQHFDASFAAFWGGALVLGGLGLAFWLVYIAAPRNWWAIIPGGVLVSLATITVLDGYWPGQEHGGVLFLGLAATFGLLYVLPTAQNRMTWALIPASICALIGIAAFSASMAVLQYVWPAGLILLGLFVLLRTMRHRDATIEEPHDQSTALSRRYPPIVDVPTNEVQSAPGTPEKRYDNPTLPQPH